MTTDNDDIDKFYVYRSLHNDEAWGAKVINIATLEHLPNISFGMKIFAKNEKEAIAKAKVVYDRLHLLDGDKENIRKFVAAILGSEKTDMFDKNKFVFIQRAMEYAIEANDQFNQYFNDLRNQDELNEKGK